MSIRSFHDLEIHKLALTISNEIWIEVVKWDSFNKFNLGSQLSKAADSIALNIAEGYGRYHFKENRQFCFYARGSLAETRSALAMAQHRKLISTEFFEALEKLLSTLLGRLNRYVDSIGKKYD